MIGEEALESDLYARTMGWRRVAERELALIRPDAFEYAVLNAGGLDYVPEDWTAVDSLAWLKAMAWDLRGNMSEEIDRVLTADAVGAARVAELYPPNDDANTPIVEQGAVVDEVRAASAARGAARGAGAAAVVAGPRRRRGQQLLGRRRRALHHGGAAARQRPHLGTGIPGVSTSHGPLVSDVDEVLGDVAAIAGEERRRTAEEEYAVALSWTALEPTRAADAILGLNLATDRHSFRTAAADFAVPAQHLVCADRAGHIGYQASGLVPIRRSGNDGRTPSLGWRAPRTTGRASTCPSTAFPTSWTHRRGSS